MYSIAHYKARLWRVPNEMNTADIKSSTTDTPDAKNAGNSDLNPPQIDKQGKPTRRAIEDAKQAWAIAKSIWEYARDNRLTEAAFIDRKYNGDDPYDPIELQNAGENWRNNFSTQFLASIVDRVKPQMLGPGKTADVLTNSSLPEQIENAQKKSRIFQERITGCIRSWSGYNDFRDMLAQETVLHGVATPGWLGDDWRPRLYKYNESFFPMGTAQHAGKVQTWVVWQPLLIHEFLELFEDKQAAEIAQYNVEGCIATANESRMGIDTSDDPMKQEDAKREYANLAQVYQQMRMIELYHVIVREYDGSIDLWTVSKTHGHEVRHVKGLHEKMEDAVTLITFQTGNMKFYGSKGLGRMLVNLHVAIERGRCLAKDQEYLGGLVILRTDRKNFNSIQTQVRHPFIIVDKDAEIAKEQIEFNAQDFEIMDAKLVSLAESIAGAFIPPNIETGGSPNTKIEAAQKAEREIAVREGVLGRFIAQEEEVNQTMQRKICSTDNIKEAVRVWKDKQEKKARGLQVVAVRVWKILMSLGEKMTDGVESEKEVRVADQESVDCLVAMLDVGLTPNEIAILSTTPGSKTKKQGADVDVATVGFLNEEAANPLLDQRERLLMKAGIVMGTDRANRVILPQDDPNVKAIAQRQQMIEIAMFLQNMPMPVASTDNHPLHRQTIAGQFSPIIEALQGPMATPPLIQSAKFAVSHYMDHLNQDMVTTPEAKKQEQDGMNQWMQIIEQAERGLQQQAQQVSAQQPQIAAQGAGGPPAGPEPADHIKAAELQQKEAVEAGKLVIAKRDQDLRQQELGLKADQQAHEQQKDVVDAGQKVALEVAKTGQQGMQDAQRELEANAKPETTE